MTDNFGHLTKDEFEELKKVFYSQAYEIVEDLQELVLRLESSPEDNAALKTLKRHIHTLKGDSNSLGLSSVGAICHGMEDLLSSPDSHAIHETADLLLDCVDTVSKLLTESESGTNGVDTKMIMDRMSAFLRHDTEHTQIKEITREAPYTEYQELQIDEALKKDLGVHQLEIVFHPMCRDRGVAAFMVAEKLGGMGQIIRSMPDMDSTEIDNAEKMTILFSSAVPADIIRKSVFIGGITTEIYIKDYSEPEKKIQTSDLKAQGIKSQVLMIEVSKVDRVMNLVGELIIGRSMIGHIARDMYDGSFANEMAARLLAANSYMERTVSDLQKSIRKMRMVPINHIFRKFPKIVRDLSAEKGKRVRLDLFGKETELDKGIVDAMGEPLSHIVRNLIDHGIEPPDERRAAGKNEEGAVTLKAFHEAAHIVIEASDDGRGTNTSLLKKKAVEKGFMSAEAAERLSEVDAINLMFLPGLSTAEVVNETSGRGIGMDAVKSVIEGLKGSIEVESTLQKGTLFRLRLPLTLAVIKALLFEVNGKLYAVPVTAISEVTRVMTDDLVTVDGKDTLMLRDRIISIVRLQELFGAGVDRGKKKFALILGMGGKNTGIITDRLLGQQELVIKAVDADYTGSDFIAGASVLGDGKIVLILDAPALIRKAIDAERKKMAAL